NTGWFAALYGMAGTYDIRLFPKDYKSPGYQSNFAYTLGLAAGYTLPIGRRTYLEFELGLGILGGEYKKYRASYCDGCYPLLEKKRSHYFGPTKAAINLVWNIGKVEDSKREEARPAR
ncbi:MAG: DUF3575 domain-containing protein, partial [Tannerella sp.]|nr:DUF3575 domain-containing protein [Tannerella sp.]